MCVRGEPRCGAPCARNVRTRASLERELGSRGELDVRPLCLLRGTVQRPRAFCLHRARARTWARRVAQYTCCEKPVRSTYNLARHYYGMIMGHSLVCGLGERRSDLGSHARVFGRPGALAALALCHAFGMIVYTHFYDKQVTQRGTEVSGCCEAHTGCAHGVA